MKAFRNIALAVAVALTAIAPVQAQTLRGQVVAGTDNGTTARNLLTDNTGRLLVVGSAAGNAVYGPDAISGAGTQPPVRIGGSATNATGGTINSWIVNSAGAGSITGANTTGAGTVASILGVMTGGSDGTNYRHLSTDTAGRLNIWLNNGIGTPGSAVPSQSIQIGGTDGTNLRTLNVDNEGTVEIMGNRGSGVADAGSPVKVGGVYNTTLPTFTNGQRGDFQVSARGVQLHALTTTNGDTINTITFNGHNNPSGSVIMTGSLQGLSNGSNWNMALDASGAAAGSNGTGIATVQVTPNTAASGAIAPSVSAAVESNKVFKASAGNLYRVAITTGASSGYLMVFDATSAPADGAVTPKLCRAVAANSSLEVDHSTIPDRFATGITAVFSTTGCFTKTASATVMFEGSYN